MTATPPPGQPDTPAEALRWAAERLDAGLIGDGTNTYGVAAWLRRWADELDAAPATPERVGELGEFAAWLEYRDLPPNTTLAALIQHEREAAAIQARFELARATDPGPAAPTTYQLPAEADLLAAIDNALRNGSYMTGANLAFDYLCDRLGVNRDGLAFDPAWVRPPLPSVPPAGTEADHAT